MRVTEALFPSFLHARDGWEGLAQRQAGLLPDSPAVAAICAEAAALFARPEGELVARAAALIEMAEHDAASLAAVGGAHAHARENHGFWESFTQAGLRAAGSPRLADFLGRRRPWLESFAPVTARFRACGFPRLHFAALHRLAAAAGTPAPVAAAGRVALDGPGVSTGLGLFNGDVEFAGTLAQPLGPVPRGALPGLLACLGALFPAAERIRLADGGATRRFLLEGRLQAFVATATLGAEAVVFVVSAAGVDVLVADDVVLAEIAAGLHLDQHHRQFAGVLHPVHGAQRDVDRLVLGHQLHVAADGHLRGALHHDPVLGAVVVALQAERRAGVHDDALDLEARAHHQALEPAPGAVVARQALGLGAPAALSAATASLTSLRPVAMGATSTASGMATAMMSVSPMPTSLLPPSAFRAQSGCLAVDRGGMGRVRHCPGIRPGLAPDRLPAAEVRPAAREGHHGEVGRPAPSPHSRSRSRPPRPRAQGRGAVKPRSGFGASTARRTAAEQVGGMGGEGREDRAHGKQEDAGVPQMPPAGQHLGLRGPRRAFPRSGPAGAGRYRRGQPARRVPASRSRSRPGRGGCRR
jgi:hypothetical protein